MSKSKQNYPPVSEIIDEQGADALRFFLINSPLVRGENVSLSADEVDEVVKKVIYRFTNTYSFIEMYTTPDERKAALDSDTQPEHVLDRWILARLDQLTEQVTDNLESYELDKASRPFVDFADDLSTWYLRRSRDRIRGEEGADRDQAIQTSLYVLQCVSLTLAPFMPFLAEQIYQDVTFGEKEESVHLEKWPSPTREDSDAADLLEKMKGVREAASHAHDLRSQAGIKVRQPLATLTLQKENLKTSPELLDILTDEVNVEAVAFDTNLDEPCSLDTELTDTLKEKGAIRELVRNIQRLRKQADLDPETVIELTIDTDDAGEELISKHEEEINSTASASRISFASINNGDEVSVHEFTFSVSIS